MNGETYMSHRLTKGNENQPHPHLNPLPEGEETFLFPPLQGEGQGGDGVFSEQKGFTYIAVMMLVVIMGITLSMTGRYWSTIAKRDREEELLFRGDQIRKGIEMYYKWTAQKHGGSGLYPESLEELLKSKYSMAPKRSLRRMYKDPITGKSDWIVISDPATKKIMGVRSASDEEPLKTSNFPLTYREFEGKNKYSDWVFAYASQAPAQPKK
ncbi:MAG: type II secretion system protein [Deltaproteobacteria bacterium]|nr:type II secretion system protein [Deltaproteobacteria bacterium]